MFENINIFFIIYNNITYTVFTLFEYQQTFLIL